jgi:NAD(P)H-dependent flavin oxidoreductase YrpB (nitropropane dioxygenase family)
MATRFVLSKECDVHENFKNLLLHATEEDLMLIQSPVGLPARAIKTAFSSRILDGTVQKPTECQKCLKHCSKSFCIIKSLQRAREGDLENGLFFTGGNVGIYNDIISVKEIFERLEKEIAEALEKRNLTTIK